MARIRTVKPELWTDEDFIEMSHPARLMFVASLNFASDYGVLPDKPRTLAMQCIPGDSVDARALIEEIVSARFYVRRVAPDGTNVLVIRTFAQNQVIQRKTAGRWGDPDDWPKSGADPVHESHPAHIQLNEPSHPEGKGREWNGEESFLRDDLIEPSTGCGQPSNVTSLNGVFSTIDGAAS